LFAETLEFFCLEIDAIYVTTPIIMRKHDNKIIIPTIII